MKTTVKCVVAGLVATCVSSVALAQVKPEDEIRYRQSVMNVIGRNFGTLVAMAKGERPFDAAAAQKAAVVVETLSGLPWAAFGPGTEKGAPTKADPKVWTEVAKFKDGADKMQVEVRKLPAATKDLAALKAQVGELGKTCKGCHDDFRQKEFRN